MSRLRLCALVVVGTLTMASCALVGGGGTYDVVAFFPRAVSLYEQGSVQVLGLPAGEITDIEVVGDQVRVTMAIDDDVPVPSDVKAAIVPQSLIGERRIQLFPPFQEGDETIGDGFEITADNTIVPIEPDEALAALKEFLDSLDPNGVGRLIDNAATALDGQGENLGSALDELSKLVGNLEANDDDIISIAERFDDFTATLLTRETQLAQALDDFAVVADVLADERSDIELLVRSLASLSENGLDIVSEHTVRLRTDIDIVTRLVRSIDTNLEGVQSAVTGGRNILAGFIDAYNPELRAIDLRNSFSPLVTEALGPVFDSVGVPIPCVPVDVVCPEGGIGALEAEAAVATSLGAPSTPVSDIIGWFGHPATERADHLTRTRSRREHLVSIHRHVPRSGIVTVLGRPRRAVVALLGVSLLAASCSLPGNVTGSREISATFDDVGDLVTGHSVQVADVRIGSIVDIELTDDYRARVTMSIKDGIFVPAESQALLRTTSLLGEKFIELRPLDTADPMAGTNLVDGDVIDTTSQAPELEFVAERAVEILGSVVASDVATLVESGSVGFGGRGTELRALIDDLSTVSATLADQTDELVRIIDALDGATATLANGAGDIDGLLRNLADTTTVLADNRDVAIESIRQLTRLAQIQNDTVFEPYLAVVDTQIKQLDAILAAVDQNQQQVADVLVWLSRFAEVLPKAVPRDFAQVYGLIEVQEPGS